MTSTFNRLERYKEDKLSSTAGYDMIKKSWSVLYFRFWESIQDDVMIFSSTYVLASSCTNCRSYRSVKTACLCAKRNRSFRSAALHVSSGDHKSSSVGGATKSGSGLLSWRRSERGHAWKRTFEFSTWIVYAYSLNYAFQRDELIESSS